MNAPNEMPLRFEPAAARREWGDAPTSRAPGWVYTDPEVYREELERFFYRGHWAYVGLECEVPGPGDFKRTSIGERSVILVRGKDGALNVVENRCAHRGVAFCRERRGTVKDFTCPYHQWNYDLEGKLVGLPFRRGVKRRTEAGVEVQGGMPEDFKLEDHGLTRLKVAARGGAVFASFDAEVEPLEDYLGPAILPWFDRCFDGRPLTLLGINRQRIPANWKLMQENIKDPYHPGLLHTWFVTFGLWRADQTSRMVMDAQHRHAAMISTRNAGGGGDVTQGVTSFRDQMSLQDDRVLDVVPEAWWNGPSVVMQTIFPSLIVQQQVNSLSTRQIIPAGPGAFDFVWTHFGFADDDAAMTRRRLRQANLFGPAGYVSADDGEVIEFVQRAFAANDGARTLSELDGREAKDTPHMVTETLIRGMYGYWRGVMGV
ncbi:aromatic ring-hydroxylating dioxygenase subunit alpha [uncultured Methylibium sp.]|uniref:aromatic ring-hydroxylating dioxygenase subunit alpha n=1 Tax=uncultured Methylibium sp. TaxID=381093 RepID=UPI0025F8BE38|nr:aromatic ring-hydroxylating dioxygenase subunit alpha [uncultured Methylibium sp.]